MKQQLRLILTPLLILLPFTSLTLADNGKIEAQIIPELKAYRINPHPPTVDGMLDDSAWCNPKIEKGRFTIQRNPDEGLPVTESTLVAVAYDDQALYAAFWCYDSQPDKISRQLVRRDRSSQSDRVTVRIDPFHDHQTGNAFEVNAAGVQRDCRYFNESNIDMEWDAVWESGVRQQPWGWSAEVRIPYNCLRFSEKDEQSWGIDFIRFINRKNESAGWAFTPVAKGGFVSNFGHLNGLTGIRPAGHLELLPYAVSSEETEPKSPGNTDGRSFMKNMGLDLKYGLASDLVLDATINPDFGQVELDQPVLNLSTYETFFAERRPFFLEGSDLFATQFNLFYSRRIGRPPRGSIDDPEFIYYTYNPKATTILGAAKLTGKLFKRTTIALLSAVTQRETAEYNAQTNVVLDSNWIGDSLEIKIKSADTVSRSGVVESEANYTVLRIKQDLFRNSSIGGMITLANQKSYNPTTTGGFDWRLSTNNNSWQAVGQMVFSRVNGAATGFGINTRLEKTSGKHILGEIGFMLMSPDLRLNRLGFNSRADEKGIWAWVQYRTTDDWWIIKESYNNLNFHSDWNYDGVNIGFGGNFNTSIFFTNYWQLNGGVEIQGEKYSDVETRGNGLWQWPVRPTVSWWFSLITDPRKKITFNWNPGAGSDRGGTWWANYIGLVYRPKSNMEFEGGVNYTRNLKVTRWVQNIDDQSLFADLDRNEIFLSGSAGIVLNRDLSIQLSAQGLASGLNYGNYRFYQGSNNYYPEAAGYNYDYNYSEMNSTLLLRWEYRPGSTFYLVWTRSRPEFDPTANNLDLSRDIKRLFSANAQNIFLIKASYWMNI